MDILRKDQIPPGGFAGLREKRLVVDDRMWGGAKPQWGGMGNFIYLADANFFPKGQTNMHPHREVDVISVMIDGRIDHEGSLEHGASLLANQAQVQRAGGEGFEHNEVNPDDAENRMLQIWVLPETAGEPAGYRAYDLRLGGSTRIYGGSADQSETFASATTLNVARLKANQSVESLGRVMAYVARGRAEAEGEPLEDGTLVRGEDLTFKALVEDTLIVLISAE